MDLLRGRGLNETHSRCAGPRVGGLPRILSALLLGAPVLSFAQQASSPSPAAQDQTGQAAPTGELQEVVVTAQRRAENLQNVPISVTALSGGQLQTANVTDLESLPEVAPSLNFDQEAGWAEPHLRGVGTTATGPGIENSVAMYVDGVYHAAMIGGNVEFNDVQDVEVINGPQGTLFGRNATGGLIQIRTKDPTQDFSGTADVGYGDYDTSTAGLYVTGGLTNNLAANLSVDSQYQGDGYGRNITTDADVAYESYLFTRSKFLYTPIEDLRVLVAVDYGRVHFSTASNTPVGSVPFGGGPVVPPEDTIGPVNPDGLINEGGATLNIDYNLQSFHLINITAYRITDSYTNESPESTTNNPDFQGFLTLDEPHRQFSQELQLVSPSEGPFTWTTGAYYFHETAEYNPVTLWGPLFGGPSDIYYYTRSRTDSYALYGQGTYAIQKDTHFTAGFRYTEERRSVEIDNPVIIPGIGNVGPPPTYGAKTFSAPSWRLALDHRFNDELMGYVSYNRGFKSGGFNPAQVPAISYKPEKLDAFEIGLKANTADNRLRFNVSPFYYKYDEIQVESFANAILLISNGADAKLYGVDIGMDAQLTQQLTLHAGTTLLHSEFTYYPDADLTTPFPGGGNLYTVESAAGHRLPCAPAGIGTLGLNYVIPSPIGNFTLNASYTYNSGFYLEPDNRLKQPNYNMVSSQLAWLSKGGVWEVDLWGKNLTNSYYALAEFSESQGDVEQYAPPRTYGFRVRMNF